MLNSTPVRNHLNLGSPRERICEARNRSRDDLPTWTREARAKSMLVIRIIQLQFLFLCSFRCLRVNRRPKERAVLVCARRCYARRSDYRWYDRPQIALIPPSSLA